MYEYIDHVLASYFSASAEESEDEAVSSLRKDLAASPTLAKELCAEVDSVFMDKDYSWKNALAHHDVLFAHSEEEARSYARKILWEPAHTL